MSQKRSENPSTSFLAPFYAAVGATESAIETLRDLGHDPEGDQAAGLAKLRRDAEDVARGATRVPSIAVAEAKSWYAGFVERGQKTVTSAVPTVTGLRADRAESRAERADEARERRRERRLARQAEDAVARGRDVAQKVAADAGQVVERTVAAVRLRGGDVASVVEAATSPAREVDLGRLAVLRRAAVTDTAVSAMAPTERVEGIGTESGMSAGVEAASASRARRVARARAAAGAPAPATTGVARKAAQERRAGIAKLMDTLEHTADTTSERHDTDA